MAWWQSVNNHCPKSLMTHRLRTNLMICFTRWTHWGRDKLAAIFQPTFSIMTENVWILISLKFVLRGSINNIATLVETIAWHRPLSESMMVSLLMHFCVTRLQWVILMQNGCFVRKPYSAYIFGEHKIQACVSTRQLINSLRFYSDITRQHHESLIAKAWN